MHDDNEFLSKLLEHPADDTARLVYADWLDERGDDESKAKARFLRLTVRLTGPIQHLGWRNAQLKELQELAATLSTDWLAVVSRLKVEGCPSKAVEQTRPSRTRPLERLNFFKFVCDKRWDEMAPTEDDTVRRCERCERNVHYCDTLAVARRHAEVGNCIAVDLGVIRREDDLRPQRMWLGEPSEDEEWIEEQRCRLDAVSMAREERKRQQNADRGGPRAGEGAELPNTDA